MYRRPRPVSSFAFPDMVEARRRGWWFVALLVAGLALSACSSDSAEGDAAADPSVDPAAEDDAHAEDDEHAEDEQEGDGHHDEEHAEHVEDTSDARGDVELTPIDLPPVDAEPIPAPEELLPEVTELLASVSEDEEILTAVAIPDDPPTAEEIASFRDGHARSPSGELITLDESASLACADVEIALIRLDDGDTASARRHIASSAVRSAGSELAEVRAWSETLGDAAAGDEIDLAPLVGYLTACVEGGHEL